MLAYPGLSLRLKLILNRISSSYCACFPCKVGWVLKFPILEVPCSNKAQLKHSSQVGRMPVFLDPVRPIHIPALSCGVIGHGGGVL
jgi:hypothetical protein